MTYIFTFCIAACAAVSDLKSRRIKNRFLQICLLIGIIFRWGDIVPDGLFGMIIPFLIFLVPYLLGAIGAADIKLLSVLGLYLGPREIIIVITLSVVYGALYCLAVILLKGFKTVKEEKIPFAVSVFMAVTHLVIVYR